MAISDAKNATQFETSSPVPRLPEGILAISEFLNSSLILSVISVLINPGETQFTLMFFLAYSIAKLFEKDSEIGRLNDGVRELKSINEDLSTGFEETKLAFNLDNEDLKESEIVDATPEYDSGEVEIEELLNDEMSSNYELNTVEETDYEDLLADAKIIGDVPTEVSFES